MNTRVIRWLYRLSNLGLIFVLVTGLALGSARPVEAASPIYVDDSWVGKTPGADPDGDGPAINFSTDSFATIQEGVTAVDAGGTVQVYAGTYTEQISINKNLTLTGEDRLTTIIEAPAVMSEACNTSDLLPNRPILCVTGGAIATIQGFTFDGLSLGSTNLRLTGVAFRNAGGVFQDNIIRNIRFSGLSSAQEGVGFYLFNSDLSPTRDIQILNNTIQNFNKNGITLTSHEYWSPATFLIQGNTISGITPNSTIAQNGIQIELVNGSGTVSGNTISNIALNNTGKPDPLVASSIYVITTPVTTSGNTISGAQTGVYYFDGVGLISENTISVVKPGVNAYGIVATDPPWAVPSPYDSAYNPGEISQNGLAVAGPPPPISVEVAGNTISFGGADNTNTAGITSEAGVGANQLDLNVHDNTVSGFEDGVEFHQCEPTLEACSYGYFSSIRAVSNNLFSNVNGLTFFGAIDDLITPIEVHHNRLLGNTTGLSNETYGGDMTTPILIVAENNWWGCNAGPGDVDCDSFFANDLLKVDADPWLVMTAAAIPGPINLSATAPFTVDLNHNSDLALLTPGDAVPATVPVTFFVTTLGSVLPAVGFYTSGEVTTTFTAPTSAGTYEICGTTDNQSVCSSVTVEDFNDAPVITGQSPLSTPEETPLTITLADLNVTDPDNTYPTDFILTVQPGTNYSLLGNQITPEADFNGDLTVPVIVNDGQADSNTFNLSVTVTPLNDAPVIIGQATLTTPEETALEITLADLTVGDIDNTYPTDFNLTVQAGTNYSLVGNTITPAVDFVGDLTVNVTVSDGEVDSAVYGLLVTVTAANDAPIAGNQSVSTPYETDLDITLTMSDVDGGSPVTWTVIDAPLHGSLSGTAPNLTYTPEAGYSGGDSFTFKVNDGGADSNIATVTITVEPQVMYSILLPVIFK
ncbi:MAG: tandem-95 repeat protein [Chloroflexi bacterium]|nr:MAG: tandem-95 repeat protein [Chloroflexota bacterium]